MKGRPKGDRVGRAVVNQRLGIVCRVAAAENQRTVERGAKLRAEGVAQFGATGPVGFGNVQVSNAALVEGFGQVQRAGFDLGVVDAVRREMATGARRPVWHR